MLSNIYDWYKQNVLEIINNKKEFRFEITFPSGEKARMEYRWLKGAMVLMHTLVPVSERGKGVGDKLAKYVLDYARAQNLKVIVYCPFVTLYMQKHLEYLDLVEVVKKK